MTIHQAMRITHNPDFQDRVLFLMVKAAVSILNGTPDESDTLLGQRILKNQESRDMWVLASLASNASIMAGAHAEDGSTIPDNDLEFSINSLWASFKL